MAKDGARFPLREAPFSVADLGLHAPATSENLSGHSAA
jgi:hypothetical protein